MYSLYTSSLHVAVSLQLAFWNIFWVAEGVIADSGAQQGFILGAFSKMSPLGHFKLQ